MAFENREKRASQPAGSAPDDRSSPRIVAFAYNCAPGEGSEGGSGWACARVLAGIGPTTVLSRLDPEATPALEARLADIPERDSLTFVHVEMPRWTRLFGAHHARRRIGRLQYLIWQFEALKVARRLHRLEPFDVAWHVTWSNVWIGSTAPLLGTTFVYGPVGGGVGSPWRLTTSLGWRTVAGEALRSFTRTAARWINPLASVAWRRASLILVQNRETRQWLPGSVRDRTFILPNVLFEEPIVARPAGPGDRRAVFAGRLIPWKGVSLAIEAVAATDDWRLVICGEGPDRARLEAVAERLGIADRVRFLGWQPRERVLEIVRDEADVFLFPSLHEEGGWAVAEAAALGVPVICLDRGGPPTLGGTAVHAGSRRETVARLARALETTVGPSEAYKPATVESRRREVVELLRRTGVLPSGQEPATPALAGTATPTDGPSTPTDGTSSMAVVPEAAVAAPLDAAGGPVGALGDGRV